MAKRKELNELSERPLEDQNITYNRKEYKSYSAKALKTQYPNGGFKIIGEITNKIGASKELEVETEEGSLYVQPLNTYKSPGYKTIGFIWNEELNGYIAVKKSMAVPIILSAIFIVAIGVVIGIVIWACVGGGTNGLDLDPNASKYQSPLQRSESMDSTSILIPGFDNLSMVAGTDELKVALLNPDGNPCYFQYDIILDQTGEILCSTKLIAPGDAVTSIKLKRPLEKGEYPITMKMNTYSLDDPTVRLNGGQVKTKIIAYANG